MSRDEVVRADGTTEVRVRHGGALTAATIMALSVAFYGSVAVLAGGRGARTPTVAEEGGGGDAEVLFWCDWRGATDSLETTANAATCVNAGDWNGGAAATNWENVFVVDSSETDLSGRGWPAAKALRMRNSDGTASGGAAQVQVVGDSASKWTAWDTTEVGESQYVRALYLVDAPDNVTESNHVLEDRDAGDSPGYQVHYIDVTADSAGWNPVVRFASSVAANLFEVRVGGNDHRVPKDTLVMLETQIRRTDVDSATLHARLSVWTGSEWDLRYDDDDWYGYSAASGQLSDSTKYPMTDWQAIRRIRYPLNGWGGGTSGITHEFALVGAIAVCRTDWCGAYPIAGVED